MNTIGESVNPWRPTVELAVTPSAMPEVDDSEPGVLEDDDGFKMFGEDGFTFLDFIDIINPLQHIPIISTIYRQMTGDTVDPGSRVIGSTLFFGPVGTVVSLANVMVNETTGKYVDEHVMAFLDGEESGLPEAADATAGGPVAESRAQAATARPQEIDPVTAWAIAEVAYRNTVAAGSRPLATGGVPGGIETIPTLERASVPAPTPATTVAPRQEAALGGGWRKAPTYFRDTRPAGDAGPLSRVTKAEYLKAINRPWTTDAKAVLADAKQGAASYGAVRYGQPRPAAGAKRTPPATPSATGAVAPYGGWFSETMVTALDKYKDSAGLTGVKRPSALEMTR